MFRRKGNKKKHKKKNKNITIKQFTINNKEKEENLEDNSYMNKTFISETNNISLNDDIKIDLNISYDISIKDSKKNEQTKINKFELKNKEYELLKIKNNLKIYKYSNIQRVYHNLIFQYFFDKFDKNDFEEAYVTIFFGKRGEGKRSTINSLFNIIKGVNIDYNYRFILIEESKQDIENGLHLYYIKDINEKPIIIINCEGFGDIRGKEYDEQINKAFCNIFTNLIHHINLVCFIGKETNEKINIFTRYIFNCATSLFSEEIIENFIIIVTNATKYIIEGGWSEYINSLSEDINYDDIKCKLKSKWKYFIDNQSIIENKIDKLTIHSFSQLNEIYKEKIINSKQKSTEKFIAMINYRNEIISNVKNIISFFNDIKKENNKNPNYDRQIKEYENKISNIINKIYYKEREIDNINYYINSYNNNLYNLEREHNSKIYDLDNQYETITNRVLESSNCEHTYCNSCKKNCHEYCDCIGFLVNRCAIFPVFGDSCDKCGCYKSRHSVHSKYRYVDKYERRKISNYDKKNEENNRYYSKRNEINNKISNKRYERDNLNREKNNLNNEKNSLQNSKNYYVNEKKKINNNMKRLSEEISSIINNLIDIEKKIKTDGLNKFHIEIEIDYINALIEEIKKNGNNKDNNDKIKKLEDYKEYIKIYDELTSNYFYILGFKMFSKNI